MHKFVFILLLLIPALTVAGEKLSRAEYNLLTQAYKQIEEGKLQQAYEHLSAAIEQVKSDYARALVQHNLGQLELRRERYKKALQHLTHAYDYKKLATEQQLSLMHTLAQLNCMEEKWQLCITYLQGWMQQADSEKINGTDYLMLAQAYSQLEKWNKVIKPVDMAIASRKAAPQSWYQLKVAAHIRLKQWRAAIRAQKTMLHHFAGKAEHWRQLVSMQLHINDEKSALATQRMAYERGLLSLAKDYRLLAQMLLQAGLPYYAGEVLEKGFKTKVLKPNRSNLRLLSNSWIKSRETVKAVSALQRLTAVSPETQSLTQLAQMQIELQDWQAAEKTLNKAIKNSSEKHEYLHLLLAITQIKLKQFDSAELSLKVAAEDEKLKTSVEGWLNYLQQVAQHESIVDKQSNSYAQL